VPRTKSADDQQELTQPCHTAEDYYRRGNVLSALNRDEEALRTYEQCLHLDPFYFDVYEHLYLMHYRKDNCESLVAIFNRAVQAFPDCAQLHLYRADLLGQLERHQEAVEACNQAIDLRRGL
jgi:tetratricopeptide (TPR) repeat protein